MGAGLPLEGVRVLELGTVISGPFAGSLLADLGAEVIKIETPGKGDVQRHGGLKKDGIHPWWGVAGRNKKFMTLNLKHAEGKAIFERLIRGADVLVENYRPGALKKLGFGWDAVHAMNPKLVMLSISGYGNTGVSAGRPGFGKIAEGLSGAVTLTGMPDEAPLLIGFSLADTCTGLFGVFGVTLGLYHRDVQGGNGVAIDLALYEPLFRMMECQLGSLQKAGVAPKRQGSNDAYGWGVASNSRPEFHCVKASNGEWFLVSIPGAAALKALTSGSNAAGAFAAHAARLDPAALRQAVTAVGAEIVPVLDGMSLSKNEYMRARGDVLDASNPKIGALSVPGPIVPLAPVGDARVAYHDASLGEHTNQILEQHLGFSGADISRLKNQGVV